ncbi:MAG: hypothetical protein ACRD8O_19670, partial [Bryobacteraceae bacterium]
MRDSVMSDNRTAPGSSFGREPGADPRDRLPEPRFLRTRYEEEALRWRHRVRGLAFLTLLSALGVGLWLGYPTLKEYSRAMVELPALQSSFTSAGLRLGQVETKLNASVQDQQSARERFTQLE